MMKTYTLTHDQLTVLLYDAISMFIEYRDVHDKTEDNAPFHAVSNIMEGIDAMDNPGEELPGYAEDIAVLVPN